MKLNRSFVQVSTTALVTSAAFIAYIILSQNKGPTVGFMKSERISWEDAKKLKKEYEEFKPLRVKHRGVTDTGPEEKENLRGFVFEAADLDEIIRSNHSSLGNPDKVVFLFGQSGTFTEFPARKRANMHIIALGMKDNVFLIDGTKADATKARASIFDKADPCPPNCPNP